MDTKQSFVAVALAVVLNLIVFQLLRFMIWYEGLPFVGFILLILVLVIGIYAKKKWGSFARIFLLSSFVVYILFAIYYSSWQLTGWPHSSTVEVLMTAPADVKANFNLVTTNFGKFPESAVKVVFSPDGKKVAYDSWRETGKDERIIDIYVADEKGVRKIGTPRKSVVDLHFSPDSKHLIYEDIYSNGEFIEDLTSIDSAHEELEQVDVQKKPCSDISIKRKQSLLFGEGSNEVALLNGHQSQDYHQIKGFVYSSDCQKVAFVVFDFKKRAYVIVVGNSKGRFTESPIHLPNSLNYDLPVIQFSSDNQVLAYGGVDEEGNIMWVVERVE